jgi:hypothetical protein
MVLSSGVAHDGRLATKQFSTGEGLLIAVGGEVILMRPFIFHSWFSIYNKQEAITKQ